MFHLKANSDEETNGYEGLNLKRLELATKSSLEKKMAPKRGTRDWFKFQYQTSPMSPIYWCKYDNKKSLKDWTLETHGKPFALFEVDLPTFNTVEKLVQDTWQQDKVGKGRDAHGLDGLNYTNITVKKIERVENCNLFQSYAIKRQELFKKGMKKGAFVDLENVTKASGKILTTGNISQDSVLRKDLFTEVNEHYMFHGTQAAVVDTIMKQGLDARLAGTGAMLGLGVYTAESSTKSDQYSGMVLQLHVNE